jgi:hypothetical protein
VHPALEDARLRLERADERLTTLDDERRVFLSDVNNRVLGRFEPGASQYVFYVEGQPPREWFLNVSECVSHIRATLDNTISHLVHNRGATVTEHHGFPIAKSETWWKGGFARDMRKGLSRDDKEIIKKFQPFVRRPEDPASDPLCILDAFRNQDLHRIPHAIYVRTAGQFPLPEEIPAMPVVVRDCEIAFFAEGEASNPDGPYTDILWVGVRVTGPDPQMRMEGDPQIDVALTDGYQVFSFDDLRALWAEAGAIVVALTPQFS